MSSRGDSASIDVTMEHRVDAANETNDEFLVLPSKWDNTRILLLRKGVSGNVGRAEGGPLARYIQITWGWFTAVNLGL